MEPARVKAMAVEATAERSTAEVRVKKETGEKGASGSTTEAPSWNAGCWIGQRRLRGEG